MVRPTESSPSTTVGVVVQALTDGIKTGAYAPGQRLIESDLTKDLAVSRGPLREAFERLAADGLVVIEPYRGALVRRLSRADLVELFQVREALEGMAARLAAERIDEGDHRRRLQRAVKAMERHRAGSDADAYMDVNAQFHELIVEFSGNRTLAKTVGQLQLQVFRSVYRRLADVTAKGHSIDEHGVVATAILSGDRAAAERAMRRHVRSSGEAVLRMEEAAAERRQASAPH